MEALRDGNFRLLFAARGVSYVGTYLAPIAVAFAILDLGGSPTEVGLGFAAWTVAQVATLAFGGVVGDRLPRRAVMIGSDSASFTVRLAMGLLLVAGHAHVWQLVALQAVGGAAVAFYSPASYGLVREVVRPELLQQANGYLAIARYAAFPLGAATGGTIVATVGSGTALLFDAATYGADMRHFVNTGHTPCVMFGAGDVRHAHAPDESIDLDDLLTATATIAVFIADWCGVV